MMEEDVGFVVRRLGWSDSGKKRGTDNDRRQTANEEFRFHIFWVDLLGGSKIGSWHRRVPTPVDSTVMWPQSSKRVEAVDWTLVVRGD
jgi:hypothetical protein